MLDMSAVYRYEENLNLLKECFLGQNGEALNLLIPAKILPSS